MLNLVQHLHNLNVELGMLCLHHFDRNDQQASTNFELDIKSHELANFKIHQFVALNNNIDC